MAVPVRDGLPSVRYGYIQAAAAYVDLDAVEAQRRERFVDPVALHEAVNTALVSLDLPTAGAYTREGISIQQSWREAVDRLFAAKRVEVNRLDQSLLDLLFLLHGTPAHPASSVPVNCPRSSCPSRRISVGRRGTACPECGMRLYPTDVLRLHDEVLEEGNNQAALGRLMQTVELLVLVGLSTLPWDQARADLLPTTLFILDGPLAMYGPSAKLRARALAYFQAMTATSPHGGPYVCGVEKTGPMADYARALARHDVLTPGDLLTVDEKVISVVTQADNPRAYGAETYWGRKFIYRSVDGRASSSLCRRPRANRTTTMVDSLCRFPIPPCLSFSTSSTAPARPCSGTALFPLPWPTAPRPIRSGSAPMCFAWSHVASSASTSRPQLSACDLEPTNHDALAVARSAADSGADATGRHDRRGRPRSAPTSRGDH
ncbi:hypothetical protein O3Q52_05695 [Streptomyces sp. ActVer]|uniref:hypothetical protein n=1 Tax=Streptomyces sp. ActVer TaxID=3014558 RepID=UPI0022B30D65|nr:hypothetical protein [Streptomyces sp. ActVer]MCZ4507711.1 hypothetical protein [Streptomyces sp. ActVer]